MEKSEDQIVGELGITVDELRADREHTMMVAAQAGNAEAVKWLVGSPHVC